MKGPGANSKRFNLIIGRVLDYLTDRCPEPAELSAEKLSILAGETDSGYSTSDQLFLSDTVAWLEAEGFIRRKGPGAHVLTLKGLEMVGSVPNCLRKD
ncbi:MAG: hypothetical protein ACLGID_05850 [Gammaproteobacteria bacterium]